MHRRLADVDVRRPHEGVGLVPVGAVADAVVDARHGRGDHRRDRRLRRPAQPIHGLDVEAVELALVELADDVAHDAEAARQDVDAPEPALVARPRAERLHGHLLEGLLAGAAHPELVGRDVRAAVVDGRAPLDGDLAVPEHAVRVRLVQGLADAVGGHAHLPRRQRRHGRARVPHREDGRVRELPAADEVRVARVAVVHGAHREPVLLARLEADARARAHDELRHVGLVRAVEDEARPAAGPLVHPELVAHDARAAVRRRVVPRDGQRDGARVHEAHGRRRARRVPRRRLVLGRRELVGAEAQVVVPARARVVALARREAQEVVGVRRAAAQVRRRRDALAERAVGAAARARAARHLRHGHVEARAVARAGAVAVVALAGAARQRRVGLRPVERRHVAAVADVVAPAVGLAAAEGDEPRVAVVVRRARDLDVADVLHGLERGLEGRGRRVVRDRARVVALRRRPEAARVGRPGRAVEARARVVAERQLERALERPRALHALAHGDRRLRVEGRVVQEPVQGRAALGAVVHAAPREVRAERQERRVVGDERGDVPRVRRPVARVAHEGDGPGVLAARPRRRPHDVHRADVRQLLEPRLHRRRGGVVLDRLRRVPPQGQRERAAELDAAPRGAVHAVAHVRRRLGAVRVELEVRAAPGQLVLGDLQGLDVAADARAAELDRVEALVRAVGRGHVRRPVRDVDARDALGLEGLDRVEGDERRLDLLVRGLERDGRRRLAAEAQLVRAAEAGDALAVAVDVDAPQALEVVDVAHERGHGAHVVRDGVERDVHGRLVADVRRVAVLDDEPPVAAVDARRRRAAADARERHGHVVDVRELLERGLDDRGVRVVGDAARREAVEREREAPARRVALDELRLEARRAARRRRAVEVVVELQVDELDLGEVPPGRQLRPHDLHLRRRVHGEAHGLDLVDERLAGPLDAVRVDGVAAVPDRVLEGEPERRRVEHGQRHVHGRAGPEGRRRHVGRRRHRPGPLAQGVDRRHAHVVGHARLELRDRQVQVRQVRDRGRAERQAVERVQGVEGREDALPLEERRGRHGRAGHVEVVRGQHRHVAELREERDGPRRAAVLVGRRAADRDGADRREGLEGRLDGVRRRRVGQVARPLAPELQGEVAAHGDARRLLHERHVRRRVLVGVRQERRELLVQRAF